MNLIKYIGEATLYDKKVMLEERKPKSWLKSISAFANGIGGALIFGVDDNNNLVGLLNYQSDSEKISEIIKTKLDPIPEIELAIHKEDDKNFIVVYVKSGNETPYYVIEGSSRTAYMRVGNESVPALSSDLKRLVLQGVNKTYDAMISNINQDKASFTKLKAMYYYKTKKEFLDSDFISFGLVSDNGNLTNAGALFADERLVYHSRIFCTRWNGLDKANGVMEAIGDSEFEGGLLYLLENAENFVKLHSKNMWKKTSTNRVEYPDYPSRAFQEAIVNAIVHRDYMELGSEVHIDIYDDRMEIYSPGGMYDGSVIQSQNIYQISSKRRNPIICDIFGRMNLMERRGSGLRKIIESYEKEDHYQEKFKPEFESTHSSFFVILKNLNYSSIDNVLINDTINVPINDTINVPINDTINSKDISDTSRILRIIETIENNKYVTSIDLARILNVSERTIKRDLRKMQSNNQIKRVGSHKDGYWECLVNDTINVPINDTINVPINDTINVPINDTINSDESRFLRMVNLIKENSHITSFDLAKILNVSESTIKRDLKKMQEEKLIERVGSRKSGSWKVLKG